MNFQNMELIMHNESTCKKLTKVDSTKYKPPVTYFYYVEDNSTKSNYFLTVGNEIWQNLRFGNLLATTNLVTVELFRMFECYSMLMQEKVFF